MDTFLAISSKRDTRRYADRPIPEDVEYRIPDAGRLAEVHGIGNLDGSDNRVSCESRDDARERTSPVR